MWISVAAELAGVHPQTLRIYERKGLVDPARTGGGSRRYSDADIALLQRISDLTDEGLEPRRCETRPQTRSTDRSVGSRDATIANGCIGCR